MYENEEGYVFVTFQDGNVIFYKDSYERHCGYRDAIKGPEGLENIQKALLYPHLITSYQLKNNSGKIFAHCKKYRAITKETISTKRGNELEY